MTKEALASPKDAALKLALEALEYWDVHGKLHQPTEEAITAIKAALAQPQQEPMGYVQTVIEALYENGDPISVDAAELLQRISAQPAVTESHKQEPVGFAVIQKPWVGLTSEERMDIIVKHNGNRFQVADEIEAKLKEKNT